MIRNKIKKLSNSQKIQAFLVKYNIPQVYLSKSREMVTNAFLIGLFVTLIPIPMQMLVIVLSMKFYKFNLPVAIALCWITNPLTMPFVYYIEYSIGSFILNSDIATMKMTIEWFQNNLKDIFIPLYLGAFILASFVSVSIYFLVNIFWIYMVKKNKKIHYTKRKN